MTENWTVGEIIHPTENSRWEKSIKELGKRDLWDRGSVSPEGKGSICFLEKGGYLFCQILQMNQER